MARDGNGNYSLASGNPVTSGATIESTWANNTLNDIASALTASIAKDGQTVPTADLPMGTNKHTGVGNATARTQYAAVGQVQDNAFNVLSSVSGTDTIAGNVTPAITAYTAGAWFYFVAANTTTSATPTLNINGAGARTVTRPGGISLRVGDIKANHGHIVVADSGGGGRFILIDQPTWAPGSATLPSVTFNGDDNTGMFSPAADTIGFSTGGTERVRITSTGSLGIGTTPTNRLHVLDSQNAASGTTVVNSNTGSSATTVVIIGNDSSASAVTLRVRANANTGGAGANSFELVQSINAAMAFSTNNTERARITGGGELLVGTTTAAGGHTLHSGASEGGTVARVSYSGASFLLARAAATTSWNAAATALNVGSHSSSLRSINASGSLNASGADYAEYERKRDDCGDVAKGDIVGFDENGFITDLWAHAVSFGVKSTNPGYVGGDTWGPRGEVEVRNEEIEERLRGLREREESVLGVMSGLNSEAEEARIEIEILSALEAKTEKQMVRLSRARDRLDGINAELDRATSEIAHVLDEKHKEEVSYEEFRLSKINEMVDAARQPYDRIAYSGKVPVNVPGALPGQYIVAEKTPMGGITGKAVSVGSLTPDECPRVVGRVRYVDEGVPVVAVIIQ